MPTSIQNYTKTIHAIPHAIPPFLRLTLNRFWPNDRVKRGPEEVIYVNPGERYFDSPDLALYCIPGNPEEMNAGNFRRYHLQNQVSTPTNEYGSNGRPIIPENGEGGTLQDGSYFLEKGSLSTNTTNKNIIGILFTIFGLTGISAYAVHKQESLMGEISKFLLTSASLLTGLLGLVAWITNPQENPLPTSNNKLDIPDTTHEI